MSKLMGHNESSAKRKIHKCPGKETGEILHKQLNSTPESSRTKRSKLTQEEQKAGNSQTQDQNQPNRNKENNTKKKKKKEERKKEKEKNQQTQKLVLSLNQQERLNPLAN